MQGVACTPAHIHLVQLLSTRGGKGGKQQVRIRRPLHSSCTRRGVSQAGPFPQRSPRGTKPHAPNIRPGSTPHPPLPGRLVAPMSSTRRSALEGSMPSICTRISVLSRRIDSCSPGGTEAGGACGGCVRHVTHVSWKGVVLGGQGSAGQCAASASTTTTVVPMHQSAPRPHAAEEPQRRSPSDLRAESRESTSSMKMTEGATWAATANSARTWAWQHGQLGGSWFALARGWEDGRRTEGDPIPPNQQGTDQFSSKVALRPCPGCH